MPATSSSDTARVSMQPGQSDTRNGLDLPAFAF